MFNFISKYIFWTKILNRLSVEKNKFWKYLPVKHIAKRGLGQLPSKFIFAQKLQHMLGTFDRSLIEGLDADTKNRVKNQADRIMDHNYDLLGSGMVYLNPINWHHDFKSGFTWGKGKFYLQYTRTDSSNNSDVKVPWELSRCHHLLWLGEAYLLTKEEKYAKEVVFQIENWIDENPLMYSINWTCAMEAAIRSVNWMYAANMIISSPHFTDNFAQKLYTSLFEHGFFIYNNLEKSIPYSANHYASDLVGLLFIGQLFSDTNKGKKWRGFALSEYYVEVRNQVLPSGAHFELSISYHRLMTELFGYSYLMLDRIGEIIPLDIHSRIRSMFTFIANYTKPNGLSPIIGDNDNGRLLPFLNDDYRDHRYLIGVAEKIFGGSLFNSYTEFGKIDNIFLGNHLSERQRVKGDSMELCKSKIYWDAGFAILRDEYFYLLFSNTGLSRYPENDRKRYGTHTHADALSFELSFKEFDFIIDPGSYVYTSSMELRNKFRSTHKHNTVTVNGLSQNEFIKNSFFLVERYQMPEPFIYKKTPFGEIIEGKFIWVIGNNKDVIHKRKIERINFNFKIQDTLTSSHPQLFEWYYHFAPDVEVKQFDNFIELIAPNKIKLTINFICDENYLLKILDDTISPSYGVVVPSKKLRISLKEKSSYAILTANFEFLLP